MMAEREGIMKPMTVPWSTAEKTSSHQELGMSSLSRPKVSARAMPRVIAPEEAWPANRMRFLRMRSAMAPP